MGGDDDDTLQGGLGDDEFLGGDGFDTADYSDHDTDAPVAGRIVQVSIDAVGNDGAYQDGVESEFDNVRPDVENVIGSNGDDILVGSDQANSLDGRDGNDTIEGLAGDDTIYGGAGADSLSGGDDNDTFFNADGEADTLDGGDGDQDTQEDDDLDTTTNVEFSTPPAAAPALNALSARLVNPDGSLGDAATAATDNADAHWGVQPDVIRVDPNEVGGPDMIAVTDTPIAGIMMK